MRTSTSPRMRRARGVGVLLAIALTAVVACGGDDEEGTTTSGLTSTVTTVGSAVDPGCPDTHPQRLEVATDLPTEAPYLDDMTACTDLDWTSTWLSNASAMVWTISGTDRSAPLVDHLGVDLRRESFLAFAGVDALLVPGAEVVVDASPDLVQWLLDASLTGTWLVHDELADKVEAYGQDQLIEFLSDGSSRRAAVLACLRSAWTILDDGLITDLFSDEPTSQLLAGLGIYEGGTECATAWQQADADVLVRYPATATWGNDIVRLGSDPVFLREGDDLFRLAVGHLDDIVRAAR